jgi:hypothetical protein
MVVQIALTILVSVVAGIATNIITDKWKVSGGGRAVAVVVVMLLIVAGGLAFAEQSIFGENPSGPVDATRSRPSDDTAGTAPSDPSDDDTTGTAGPSDDDTAGPSDEETTEPPVAGPTFTKHWSGNFLLPNVAGAELDTRPASRATGPAGNLGSGDLFYDNREALGNLIYAGDGPLAEWDGNGSPDAAACLEAVQTVATARVDPRRGSILCVGTNGGRVARLEITQAEYSGIRFSVLVWNINS